ncbi:MAG TPA: NAD(P)-binding domain-containing protein, partial [bacterium]|nr:NAD(P)-binding domain-containing protein [bacterium]
MGQKYRDYGEEIMTKRVGFVGLGRMGQPMARRLLAAGYPVTAYDIREDAVAAARASG